MAVRRRRWRGSRGVGGGGGEMLFGCHVRVMCTGGRAGEEQGRRTGTSSG